MFVQIEALRGAVRFLRSENSYLKGQGLIREIRSLPPLPDLIEPGESDDSSGTEDEDFVDPYSSSPTSTSVRALNTATKVLYRDLLTFSSTPRVVDLSAVNAKSQSIGMPKGSPVAQLPKGARKGWIPSGLMPQQQLRERALEADKLSQRLGRLNERAARISQPPIAPKGRLIPSHVY